MSLTEQLLPMATQFMLAIEEEDDEWDGHEGQEEDEENETYQIGEVRRVLGCL